MASAPAALTTDRLHLGYSGRPIVEDLCIDLPRGQVTAIVGPNGCGKSTVLRALARLLKPDAGSILIDGANILHTRTKDLARQLAILPQSSTAPSGITVRELAGYGRFPHQGLLRSPSKEDRDAVAWALEVTQMSDMQDREVDTLSGGERQRAWMAMALAQQTDILLLDEPTTYLDIRYQIDILSLVRDINEQHGITVGWVLHDLNQAAAYSDKIVMLKDGLVTHEGHPNDVLSPDAIREVFDIDCCVIQHPMGNVPVCLPNGFCGLQRMASCAAGDQIAPPPPMSAD